MKTLKVSWKIASQISMWHTSISMRITTILTFCVIVVSAVTVKLLGYPISYALFLGFILKYQIYIIVTLLIIHFIPVNLYAIISLMQYRFPKFRVVVIANDENQNNEAHHSDH